MSSVFENATRAALEEIIQDRLHESRHGYVLTKDGYGMLVDDIYRFFKASRNLKEAGDRLLANMADGGLQANAGQRPKRSLGR